MAALNNTIQTVLSEIMSNELGYCQSHEHLFIADGPSSALVPSLRLDDLGRTSSELLLYKEAGGVSIVDAQPVGCGRIPEYLRETSVQTGINIIASTGFHKLEFYKGDHWIRSMHESGLTDLFIEEIKTGMYIYCDNSSPKDQIISKAGVIKTASDEKGPIGEYLRLFKAAAEASRMTGTSILSHTEMGKGALEQIRIFTDHHVRLDSIILCHLDRDLKDMNYLFAAADTGIFMEYDTIGRPKYHSDEEEAGFIVKMVERGYEDRILIGLDTTRERMRSYGGALGLDYILTAFIPLLKSYGITDDLIRKFTIDNPANAFSIKDS